MNTFGIKVGQQAENEITSEIGIVTEFRPGATPADPALASLLIGGDYSIYVPVNRLLPIYR